MTNTFLRDDGRFAALASAGSSASGPITLLTKTSTAIITVSSTAYSDIVSVAQGSSGTWLVLASATVFSTGAPYWQCRLGDGTTTIASAVSGAGTSNSEEYTVALAGVLASPAGNLRLSFAKFSAASGQFTVRFNDGGDAADTVITAVRIG